MRSVDTNVLIRALTGDDPVQSAAAVSFIQAHAPVWVSGIVLLETVWVLESVYQRGRKELAETLERILDSADLSIETPDLVRSALTLFRSKGKMIGIGGAPCGARPSHTTRHAGPHRAVREVEVT